MVFLATNLYCKAKFGITLANEMDFVMQHVLGAGLIPGLIDLQSSTLQHN